MSEIEPITTVEQHGVNVRVTQDWSSVLDKMARDIADRIDEATLARLGYVKQRTCKPTTYDDGYSIDHLEPGEYHEFWEPACACGSCGELIPMRKFCPNCGRRLEVEE